MTVSGIDKWCLTGMAGTRCRTFKRILSNLVQDESRIIIAPSPAVSVAQGAAKFALWRMQGMHIDTCIPKDVSLQYSDNGKKKYHTLLKADTPMPASSGWSDEVVKNVHTAVELEPVSTSKFDTRWHLWEGTKNGRYWGSAGQCAALRQIWSCSYLFSSLRFASVHPLVFLALARMR